MATLPNASIGTGWPSVSILWLGEIASLIRSCYLQPSTIQPYFSSFCFFVQFRTEQVILFRLRTGHNRLNAHMYNKFKVGESEMCPCNADIMTAEHLLQHCPLHDAMRRDTWPELTLLRDKLYGKPGGAEEDGRLHEGNRHLHLAYEEGEEDFFVPQNCGHHHFGVILVYPTV